MAQLPRGDCRQSSRRGNACAEDYVIQIARARLEVSVADVEAKKDYLAYLEAQQAARNKLKENRGRIRGWRALHDAHTAAKVEEEQLLARPVATVRPETSNTAVQGESVGPDTTTEMERMSDAAEFRGPTLARSSSETGLTHSGVAASSSSV